MRHLFIFTLLLLFVTEAFSAAKQGKEGAGSADPMFVVPLRPTVFSSCSFAQYKGPEPKTEKEKIDFLKHTVNEALADYPTRLQGQDILMGEEDTKKTAGAESIILNAIFEALTDAPNKHPHMKLSTHLQRVSCHFTNQVGLAASGEQREDLINGALGLFKGHLKYFGYSQSEIEDRFATLHAKLLAIPQTAPNSGSSLAEALSSFSPAESADDKKDKTGDK